MVYPSLCICRFHGGACWPSAAIFDIRGIRSAAMTGLKELAVAIAAALAILFAAYAKASTDKAADATKERLRAVNKARKIEDETSRLSDRDVDARLGKWLRD